MNRRPSVCSTSTRPMSSSMQDGFCEPKKIAVRPVSRASVHVGGRAALKDQFGKPLEPPVPALDVQNRLAKGLVIGDRDVNRIDAALAHLAKDLFRPVGILQPVDQWRHSGDPAAT